MTKSYVTKKDKDGYHSFLSFVSKEELIEQYGSDTLRNAEIFLRLRDQEIISQESEGIYSQI